MPIRFYFFVLMAALGPLKSIASGPPAGGSLESFVRSFGEEWKSGELNRAFWNSLENNLYEDPFFARQFLSTSRNPFDLSSFLIEPGGDYNKVTLNFRSLSGGNEVKAVLYAKKEEGEWKFLNPLMVRSQTWKKHKVGDITFIYQPGISPDYSLARKSSEYYEMLKQRYGMDPGIPFDFFVVQHPDSISPLLGFSGLVPDDVPGIAFSHRRFLISGTGRPWYPHEVAHMVFNRDTVHPFINEGFATLAGGAMGKSYSLNIEKLRLILDKNPGATFSGLLQGKYGQQAFYASGALILEAALKKGGVSALHELFSVNSDEKLIPYICRIFEIREDEITGWWRKLITPSPA